MDTTIPIPPLFPLEHNEERHWLARARRDIANGNAAFICLCSAYTNKRGPKLIAGTRLGKKIMAALNDPISFDHVFPSDHIYSIESWLNAHESRMTLSNYRQAREVRLAWIDALLAQ